MDPKELASLVAEEATGFSGEVGPELSIHMQ